MNREAHVRFRERLGVKLPRPTRPSSFSKKVVENVCPEDWAIRKEGRHRPVELYKR
jgi:hypothetical protein